MFIAYMESTCIDGNPKLFHRIRHFYLKNFKRYVTNRTEQQTRAGKFTKDVFKYALTVGLSGFLILVFTLIKENIDKSKERLRRSEIKELIEQLHSTHTQISSLLTSNNKSLSAISEREAQSTKRIEDLKDLAQEANEKLAISNTKLQEIESTLQKLHIDFVTNNEDSKVNTSNKANAAAAKSRAAD